MAAIDRRAMIQAPACVPLMILKMKMYAEVMRPETKEIDVLGRVSES
jgi:hypothetical protein